jgi:hypothetical protein
MCDKGNWISPEGWQEMLRQFVGSTRSGEDGVPLQRALWIYTPDYDNQGKIGAI